MTCAPVARGWSRDSAPPRSGTTSGRPQTLHTGASGVASWYRASGLIAAAGPALRVGDWRGSTVTVCANSGGASRCLAVRLIDWCQCYRGTDRERIIDLSDDAVAALGLRLSTGLYRVTVG